MSHGEDDFGITPAMRAYLTAFDHWLKTSWPSDAALELKDACLAAIHAERPGPGCVMCGKPFVAERTRGRPRVKCYTCSPARFSEEITVR
jgi:hypothetical protein